jgi:transposase-like protein
MKKFDTLIDATIYFSDEQVCRDYLENIRWGDTPICPHCGNKEVYRYSNGKLYKCKECREQFTVKVGTIFEDSKISLSKWFVAIYLLTAHKKGISSLQLHRDLGVTQKTAWFMLQRIRYAIRTKSFNKPLQNFVECDETYVGGKAKNKHACKRSEGTQGRNTSDKTAVFGMVERGGNVIAQKVKDVSGNTLKPIIYDNVKDGSILSTDEWKSYIGLDGKYKHLIVNHGAGIYVQGLAHTNTMENFWSLLKRGIIGIYHNVSSKHIDKYIDEFEFRYNSKTNTENGRFDLFLQLVNGRLKYKELIK